MCDDGYDGDDCSVITNKDNMITDIIDNFEGSYVSEKTWMQISGGVIEDTCPSTPLSKPICLTTKIKLLIKEIVINHQLYKPTFSNWLIILMLSA